MKLRKRWAITARGFRLLRAYCPGLARDNALAVLAGSLKPFFALWFSARLIDELCGARRAEVLVGYAVALVAANCALTLIQGVLNRLREEKEARMWSHFRKVFSDKLLALDFADVEDAAVQREKKQAEENLFMFGNGLGQLVWSTGGIVAALTQIVAALALTVSLFTARTGRPWLDQPLWAAAVLALVALGGFLNARATDKENRVFDKWCRDTVWFNRAFSFYGRELYLSPERAKDARIYEQWRVAAREMAKMTEKDESDVRSLRRMAAYPALANLLSGLGDAMCYLFVAVKAFYGAFAAGGLVRYAGALARLGEGVRGLIFQWADNAVYCGHLKNLFAFLDRPGLRRAGTLRPAADGPLEIEFRGVGFRYPGAETYALREVSLRLRPGKRLALVGPNGSGKTTFVKLLCRLYEPCEGAIFLNGVDVRQYDYDAYLSLLAVVFQDFQLFALPLGQNVAACATYDAARAADCLEAAGFGPRLRNLPKGLETCLYRELDAAGVEISGGEAQKIALARALYKDAPILALDEPTAALDPVAEGEVYAGFDRLVGGKTALYISHRLSSCRFCDEIAVFEGGRIVQSGAHEALLKEEGGLYAALWRAQARYYEKES